MEVVIGIAKGRCGAERTEVDDRAGSGVSEGAELS